MGEEITLTCSADGLTITYIWQRQEYDGWTNIDGEVLASHTTSTTGNYRCVVHNTAGIAESRVAKVTLNGKSLSTQNKSFIIVTRF